MPNVPSYLEALVDQSENVPCPICGSAEYYEVYRGVALRNNHLSCVMCKQCSHFYLNPRPTLKDYKEFYLSEGYFELCAQHYDMPFDEKMQQFERDDFWAERYSYGHRLYDKYLNGILTDKDTVFDFGCGDGGWLGGLRERSGCNIDGEEISQTYANVIKNKFGFDIFVGPIEELEQPILDKYDSNVKLAIVSGSLQHMLYPMQCLEIAYNILEQDGYLYVCNWSLFEHFMYYEEDRPARLLGEILSFEHVHYFHQTSFLYMLELSGFEVIDFEMESTVRPRHMGAFARKRRKQDKAPMDLDAVEVLSKLRALESATLLDRLRKNT